MFNIDTFNSQISNMGLQRGNKFEFLLPAPGSVAAGTGQNEGAPNAQPSNGEFLRFFAKSVSFPGMSMDLFNVSVSNRNYFVAGDYRPNELTVRFYVDESMMVRDFFEEWKNRIYIPPYFMQNQNNNQIGLYTNYPDEYILEIAQLLVSNQNGEIVSVIAFNRLFPSKIGDMEFSWERENEIQTLDVTFTYYDYAISSIRQPNASNVSVPRSTTNFDPYSGSQNDIKNSDIATFGDFAN